MVSAANVRERGGSAHTRGRPGLDHPELRVRGCAGFAGRATGPSKYSQRWRGGGGSAYRGNVRDHLPPGLPPDPFAGDPSDPSAALDAIEPGEPLDPHERLAVEEDLADLAVYEALLAHRGIRGLVVSCEDCRQDHYHDWDMLRANLLQLLVDGTVRPHEPAYDPTPEAYVTWDYCRGYADASMNEALHGDGFDGFDA